ncbi:hypothetical protein ACD578_27835 (plasmid) [Microvirga sp. RSM25]|uniref:hypothetical protein n=1 Tax=Microvirga sp. RSM25 TaxID=3273802 RepID=UPI00384DA487
MDLVAVPNKARPAGEQWPGRDVLQNVTKGNYRLHSQTIEMIARQFLANSEATTERRRNEPSSRTWLRYPHREKAFHPLSWPAQAGTYQKSAKRLILPMGRGRKSLVVKIALAFEPGRVKLAWQDGYELHVVARDEQPSGCVSTGTS